MSDVDAVIDLFMKNKGHFEHITNILNVKNPEWINNANAHIFMNLYRLAKDAKYVAEFGVGDGVSALFLILANPESKIILFYEPGYISNIDAFVEYLTTFFPNRVTGVQGPYHETIPAFLEHMSSFVNLVHVNDVCDEGSFIRCLLNARWLVDRNCHTIVVNHFLKSAMVNKWCITCLGNCMLEHPSGKGLLALSNKTMGHFVSKFTEHLAKTCIVVARYNRDLTWLRECDLSYIDLYIYNKGKEIPTHFGNYYIRDLRNVGLDQASHLQFIVDHYDHLPEIILFTQDDFDSHIKDNNIYKSSCPLGNVDFYIKLMCHQARVRGFSQNAFSYQAGPFEPSYSFKVDEQYGEHMSGTCFGEWFEENLKRSFPMEPFLWFKNAIFAVNRKYILSRPKEDYMNILKQFTYRKSEIDHFMERSWYYLLNLDKDI